MSVKVVSKTTSGTIETVFEDCVDRIGGIMKTFPWEQKEAYAAWLAQTYYLVRNTTRFIALSAANTELDNRALHYEWIGHLKGELNHDLVAVNDLKALGYTTESFPELMETQLIRQNQYYWIDRGPAASLIGYALCLEGLAAKYGAEALKQVEAIYGRKASAFLRLHAEVDVGHYGEGLKTLSHLNEQELEAVKKNLLQSAFLYEGMARSVVAQYGKGSGKLSFAKAA